MALSRGCWRVALALDHDRLKDDIIDRAVVASCFRLADLIDDLSAIDDLAEDGVLTVQPGSRDAGNEELGAVGARAGIGHGQQVRPVERKVRGELVAGAAGALAERVPALDHEIRDHAVEDRPVVELPARLPGARIGPFARPLREVDEVLYRLRRVIGKEADGNRPAAGL